MKLYGIPNCDTVRRARAWLDAHGILHSFHDLRKDGVSLQQLSNWADQVGLDTLINRRGTTWRKLDAAEQAQAAHTDTALALLQKHPSLIKRPVVEVDGRIIVGFSEPSYAQEWQA